jgi:hypothetical protein
MVAYTSERGILPEVLLYNYGRQLDLTRTGKEGDEIFVARGAMLPFVLRPKERSDAHRRQSVRCFTSSLLVATSYVPSAMDGDGVERN